VRAIEVVLFIELLATMIAINDVQTTVNTLVQLRGPIVYLLLKMVRRISQVRNALKLNFILLWFRNRIKEAATLLLVVDCGNKEVRPRISSTEV